MDDEKSEAGSLHSRTRSRSISTFGLLPSISVDQEQIRKLRKRQALKEAKASLSCTSPLERC